MINLSLSSCLVIGMNETVWMPRNGLVFSHQAKNSVLSSPWIEYWHRDCCAFSMIKDPGKCRSIERFFAGWLLNQWKKEKNGENVYKRLPSGQGEAFALEISVIAARWEISSIEIYKLKNIENAPGMC